MARTSIRWMACAAVAASVLAAGAAARAEAGGAHKARASRPIVMIMLDTSGSMEWRADANPSAGLAAALPTCTPGAPGYGANNQFNRWLTALQALTGTFDQPSYYCCEAVDAGPCKNYTGRTGGIDDGYYIPHIDVPRDAGGDVTIPQNADGLLDLYVDEVAFGLATMDSFPDPSPTAAGMWSFPANAAPWPIAARHAGVGAAQQIAWQDAGATCTYNWNAGVRGPDDDVADFRINPGQCGTKRPTVDTPGGLIGAALERPGKAGGWWKNINDCVQQEMLNVVRPYWSSPIGAMLDDILYYFDVDLDVRESSGGVGDCYWACRDRHAILITDGVPNTDGQPSCDPATAWGSPGACPYNTAEKAAQNLYDHDPRINLHVIGFGVENETAADGRTGKQVAWDIGLAGAGGALANCADYPAPLGANQCALYADDLSSLRLALNTIVQSVVQDAASQTQTATINTHVTTVMGQYQFYSSMDIGTGGTPWEGNLERVAYECGDPDSDGIFTLERTSPGGYDVYDYGDDGVDTLAIAADAFNTRPLYTVVPAVADPINPNPLGKARALYPLDATINRSYFNVATDGERDDVLNWMHGTDAPVAFSRKTRRLGAIYHTTPAIVGAPTLELALESYNVGPHVSGWRTGTDNRKLYSDADDTRIGFRQLYQNRREIVYAATMDGLLHAFEVTGADEAVGDMPDELWGFVPPMLLTKLEAQLLGQQFLLDGNIAVQDVRLWREADGSCVSLTQCDEWATVLIMGLRLGGGLRGYFALDVTGPEVGLDAAGVAPGGMVAAGTAGTELGTGPDPDANPYGEPRLLWQITPTSSTQKLVAADPATYDRMGLTIPRPAFGTVMISADPDHGNRGGEVGVVFLAAGADDAPPVGDEGCALYVVKASNGKLIRMLAPSTGCNPDVQLVGSPVAVGGIPGHLTTRVFVGDSEGVLYRANLSDPDPAEWTLEPFFDFENSEPIYAAPAVAISPEGDVVLVFGTGNPDDLETTPLNRMASVTERFLGVAAAVVEGTCDAEFDSDGLGDGGGTFVGAAGAFPDYCSDDNTATGAVFPWVNWVIEMDPGSTALLTESELDAGEEFAQGERLLGSPVVFDDVAYFTTFVPHSDPDDCCSAGWARVFGVHYVGAGGYDTDVRDVRPATNSASGEILMEQLADGSIAYGLSVVRRPSCFTYTDDTFDDWLGRDVTTVTQAQPAEYDLVVHTSLAPELGAVQHTGAHEIPLARPPVECTPDAWASIFGL